MGKRVVDDDDADEGDDELEDVDGGDGFFEDEPTLEGCPDWQSEENAAAGADGHEHERSKATLMT